MNKIIIEMKEKGILDSVDVHFAKNIYDIYNDDNEIHKLFYCFVSSGLNEGNIYFLPRSLKHKEYYEDCKEYFDELINLNANSIPAVGIPDDNKPIIHENGVYFLHRYYHFKTEVKKILKELSDFEFDVDEKKIKDYLNKIYEKTEEINLQKVAVAISMKKGFTVISGGPGTGKTTTVINILRSLIDYYGDIQIKIAAPTGKAAMRIKESITNSVSEFINSNKLDENEAEKLLQFNTLTIHRLLGYSPTFYKYRHDRENPLDADVLIIDESSMIDLAMMFRILIALKKGTRLILLGDRFQLDAVNPGSVFGDICGDDVNVFDEKTGKYLEYVTGFSGFNISNDDDVARRNVIQFNKSFRFPEDGLTGKSSFLIKAGKGFEAYEYLTSQKVLFPLNSFNKMFKSLLDDYFEYFKFLENDVEAAFEKFNRLCFLSPVKKGEFGVEGLNTKIELLLSKNGLINLRDKFYNGRPILILKNDYNVSLFNGDIGICVYDKSENKTFAYFVTSDGSYRKIHISRLPEHQTAYAMTVHKSQGSEFDNIIYIQPDIKSDILTREMIYTAITRARKNICIFANKESFVRAVENSPNRIKIL